MLTTSTELYSQEKTGKQFRKSSLYISSNTLPDNTDSETLIVLAAENQKKEIRKYSETINILKQAYISEIRANRKYTEYTTKANSENYPNIAHLFSSLAISEKIHADNFKKLLNELGVEVKDISKTKINTLNTKSNLKDAIKAELYHIDQMYPLFLEKIRPEKHAASMRSIKYSWASEKQHQDLLLKMQKYSGFFFGVLANKIESSNKLYFLCQNCGSTITEAPTRDCQICSFQFSGIKKIEKAR